MRLNELRDNPGARYKAKRLGRGIGSGKGKTAGKGHKGQKARSGGGIPPWFEGGQMPLNRRLPKRGFTNIFKKSYQLVNLDELETRLDAGKVDAETLANAGLIKNPTLPVKLLGRGKVEKSFQIEVAKASKAAVAAVEAAGGSVTVTG